MTQGPTRGVPISTDVTLSANLDTLVPSQKAVKTYVDATSTGVNTGDQTYIAPRVVSATNYTTSCTIDASVTDRYFITAQAGALLFNNPSNATNGQTIIIRIKDNGTARALTWDTQFRGIIASLPNTTRISKTMYITVVYNSTDTKWDMVELADEP